MCVALELHNKVVRPGRLVRVWLKGKSAGRFVWAGFARRETDGWWKNQGWEPVDVPAEKFAERSERTRQLAWDMVPAGMVVRGLVNQEVAMPLLKIVTRASNAEELARFEHPRMPLIEPPLFSAELFPPDDEDSRGSVQTELF